MDDKELPREFFGRVLECYIFTESFGHLDPEIQVPFGVDLLEGFENPIPCYTINNTGPVKYFAGGMDIKSLLHVVCLKLLDTPEQDWNKVFTHYIWIPKFEYSSRRTVSGIKVYWNTNIGELKRASDEAKLEFLHKYRTSLKASLDFLAIVEEHPDE